MARPDGIEEWIGELSIEQLDRAEQDLDDAWAGWTPRYSTLRQLLGLSCRSGGDSGVAIPRNRVLSLGFVVV